GGVVERDRLALGGIGAVTSVVEAVDRCLSFCCHDYLLSMAKYKASIRLFTLKVARCQLFPSSRSKNHFAEHGDRCWDGGIIPAAAGTEQALDRTTRPQLDGRL